MSRADKRARRVAEHLEWFKAQGRTEVEELGESTTGTSFLYSGDSRPTETMQMVGEVASERDRRWFEEHPQAGYRVRWSLPGEFPTEDLQPVGGRPLDLEAGRWAVVVLRRRRGCAGGSRCCSWTAAPKPSQSPRRPSPSSTRPRWRRIGRRPSGSWPPYCWAEARSGLLTAAQRRRHGLTPGADQAVPDSAWGGGHLGRWPSHASTR
jgi:hypothetical protein